MCKLLQNGFVFLFILNIIHRRLKNAAMPTPFKWGRWVIALSSPRKNNLLVCLLIWVFFSIFFAIYSRHLRIKKSTLSCKKSSPFLFIPQMFCLMFEQNNKFMLGKHFFLQFSFCVYIPWGLQINVYTSTYSLDSLTAHFPCSHYHVVRHLYEQRGKNVFHEQASTKMEEYVS